MDRRLLPVSILLLFISPVSAQITTGYGSTRSIPEMINHLLGINVYNPYEILGITATFGVLWVSTYVVFKVGIKRIDEGLDNDGYDNSGLQDALGVDDPNSSNVLAILTFLIVLTTIGTGAFLEIIRGWQSLIILAFLFALLAGLVFVIFGGAGAVIGATGASARIGARGVNQVQTALDEIGDRENSIAEEEREEEEEIDEGNEDQAERNVELTAEHIDRLKEELEKVEDQIDMMSNEQLELLEDYHENLREIADLLERDRS